MMTVRVMLFFALVLASMKAGESTAIAGDAQQRYFFKITNVSSQEQKIIPLAKELLEKEVSARPEFSENVGTAESEDSKIAELQKLGMKGFQLSMRISGFKSEVKPPAPGKKDSQMSVQVKLDIFGHTLPGGKMMFTGDGEAQLMGDFSLRTQEKEEKKFIQTALESAVKQAVNTALVKMTHSTLSTEKPSKAKKAKKKK